MHHEAVTTPTAVTEAAAPEGVPAGPLDQVTLRLLADPLRARIVALLSTEALCASHLVDMTGAKQTNISNHLRALRDAGLVTTEPCGRFTHNVLVPDALVRLSAQLADIAGSASGTLPRRACP